MYDNYFRLTTEPFRLSPDQRFCFRHARHFRARAYMSYALMRAEGFVLITGDPGTGKTTLVGDLVASLDEDEVAVAKLVSSQLTGDDLLRMVSYAFGVATDTAGKALVLQRLTALLQSLYREGRRALLIVDEAQNLGFEALEELRLLTNLEVDAQPLLQVFLLGQKELQDLVHSPGLEQVHQRIVAASRLEPLDLKETRDYVRHRLWVAGWRRDPDISVAVYPIIHRFSGGVPRRINLICSRLLLHACVNQQHRVGVADARDVVAELEEEQLSTINILNDDLFLAEDEFEGDSGAAGSVG